MIALPHINSGRSTLSKHFLLCSSYNTREQLEGEGVSIKQIILPFCRLFSYTAQLARPNIGPKK